MVRLAALDPMVGSRPTPNQVTSWVRRRSTPGGRAFSTKDFQVLLSVKYRWVRVRSVAHAVDALAQRGAAQAITPRVFKSVLREVNSTLLAVDPARLQQAFGKAFLATLEEVDGFLASRTLSWQTISDYGVRLIARSRRRHDYFVSLGQLMVLARDINREMEWSRWPSSPDFCRMCWRFTMTDHKYCAIHRPGVSASPHGRAPVAETTLNKLAPRDTYWSARKTRSTFSTQVRKLQSLARKHLLRSSWKASAARGDVSLWLLMNRPRVYAMCTAALRRVGTDEAISTLVDVLDCVPGESRQERGIRSVFHSYLAGDVAAMFDMTLRAEAWLAAVEERRVQWGGARAGAGRPRRETCTTE